ncbi:site-specific integrase [Acidiphilium sp. AL]|uniref:tyrosine-type recombinase/integrase n=1 Tax=Acidiphilium sp. AL TaxID=2871704 RepID=UPI0021CB92F9|nr:site-specific integrase [Acidiphilium sp. AL]MCU4161520.1 site-specific integrase [Acidiphilium sp. AL]
MLDAYEADKMAGKSDKSRCHLNPLRHRLGPLNVETLSVEVGRRYLKERQQERKPPISGPTVRRELGALQAALNWAQKRGWIANVPHVELPPSNPPRDRWLTPAEAERLMACAVHDHVRMFIALGLFTAGRASALLELTWDRVDFERRMIDLGEGNGNKRRAKVPIADPLLSLLVEARKQAVSDYVVEYRGSRVLSVKRGFRASADRAGLKGVSPHTLRHTAASWMVQRGISYNQIAGFLGNSVAMIEAVYGHHSPDYLRDAANALTSAIGFRGHVAPETDRTTQKTLSKPLKSWWVRQGLNL